MHLSFGTSYDWSKPRPSCNRSFNNTVATATTDGRTGVGISVTVGDYQDNVFDGQSTYDCLHLYPVFSAETREGITYYESGNPYPYSWQTVTRPTNITANNSGALLSIADCAPYLGPILLYGVSYTDLWVSDNGFLSFNSTQNDSSPYSLPNSAYRHSVIAPLWRDLIPDASSSITYDEAVIGNRWALIISWNNIRDVTGNRQTFQVAILPQHPNNYPDSQSLIIFCYNSITYYQSTEIGIQNQAGSRGTSIDSSHAYSSHYLELFSPDDENYELTRLNIKLDKSTDSDAGIFFEPPGNASNTRVEGYNIQKQSDNNPWGSIWTFPIDFSATLFLTGVTNPAAGLVCDMALLTFDTAATLTDSFLTPYYGFCEAGPNRSTANVNASTEADFTWFPFDADIATCVSWRFWDSNSATHTLVITGEAVYQSVDGQFEYTATSCLTLNLFTGQHYLDVNTAYDNGGGPITGVDVMLDQQHYTSPLSLSNVSDGNHVISVQSDIFRNGIKYHFDHWEPNSLRSNPLDLDVNQDYNYTVIYTAYVCYLTINTTYGGNTNPHPGVSQHQYGDTVGVMAHWNVTGYQFKNWLLNGSFYSSYNAVNVYMDNNYLLQAQFDNHYNLTVSSTLWGNTDPYPDLHTYTYGTSLNVTALPWTSCVFDYWTLDGTNYTSPNPMPINMTANHSIMAHFHDASGGGGEGCCPTLFSWSGTDYAYYGVIPLHNASGYDVIKEVPVNTSDVGVNNYQAQFRLREGWLGLNSSESVIDQVKLYAVDAYGHRLFCPLVNATHSRLGNVLPQLLFSDDWRAQMTLLETVDLRFVVLVPEFPR